VSDEDKNGHLKLGWLSFENGDTIPDVENYFFSKNISKKGDYSGSYNNDDDNDDNNEKDDDESNNDNEEEEEKDDDDE
jgi:hypothetical protein